MVAAAGSGKTSVIVAKTGWLVRKRYRTRSELLLLAFARDARREMEERMAKRLDAAIARDVTVRTFHGLGMAIMADVSRPRRTGGREVRRENASDGSVFYGCSNNPLCEHTAPACPRCGNGLPVRSGNAYRCRDCDGTIEACPVFDGWLNTKWGPRGRFLGCSNFPDCKYTRNLRESTGRGTEQKRTNLEQRRRR